MDHRSCPHINALVRGRFYLYQVDQILNQPDLHLILLEIHAFQTHSDHRINYVRPHSSILIARVVQVLTSLISFNFHSFCIFSVFWQVVSASF